MFARLSGKLQQVLDALAVEADDDLIADDQSGGGAALIDLDQFMQPLGILGDVLVLEVNLVGREKLSRSAAGRSAGLSVEHHALRGHALSYSWVSAATGSAAAARSAG